MSNLKTSIDDFLLGANRTIENALIDALVKAQLGSYGYPEEKILAGKALYVEAAALQLTYRKEYGEKVAATAELNDLWEEADKKYMMALKIARVALKDLPKSGLQVLLYGSRKQSLSGWLEQVRAFYNNIINDGLHRLQDATLIKTEEFPQGINPKIYLLLNQREITVLKLVGLGKQNKEIAAQTFLSEGSVTNMISGLCDKLELESRIHLAVFAFVHGLVTKEELKIKDEIDGKNNPAEPPPKPFHSSPANPLLR